MLKNKKMLMCLAIIAIMALSFTSVALADTGGTYYHSGFSNYFYSSDTITKSISTQNDIDDLNYLYERLSDRQPGTYTSRIYCGYSQASSTYMTVYSGTTRTQTLSGSYYNSMGYVYRLKLNNGTGIKYEIGGDYFIN